MNWFDLFLSFWILFIWRLKNSNERPKLLADMIECCDVSVSCNPTHQVVCTVRPFGFCPSEISIIHFVSNEKNSLSIKNFYNHQMLPSWNIYSHWRHWSDFHESLFEWNEVEKEKRWFIAAEWTWRTVRDGRRGRILRSYYIQTRSSSTMI